MDNLEKSDVYIPDEDELPSKKDTPISLFKEHEANVARIRENEELRKRMREQTQQEFNKAA